MLNGLPLLRPWGLADNIGGVCLVLLEDDLQRLDQYLEFRPRLDVRRIMLVDHDPQKDIRAVIRRNGKSVSMPVCGLDEIAMLPQYEKVFPFPEPWFLTILSQKFTPLGLRTIWLDSPGGQSFGKRAPMPDFFIKNARNLFLAYDLFFSEEDRMIFAARIKAILTGEAGWLPVAGHPEYQHPEVGPRAGDVMIDGGVSDMVGAQAEFSRAVGESGRVHGFEPIPWMAEKAARQLAVFPQYSLHCAGLGERKEKVAFASLRDSSHICDINAADAVVCDMTTIDSFMDKEKPGRLDCIKLDVEGAELLALRGASRSIRKFRPQLIICLYHKPEDIFTIPLFIHGLVPEYRLHLAHSSCGFTDTILYAHVPGK